MTSGQPNRASAASLLMGSKVVMVVLQLVLLPVCVHILGKDGNGFALWVMNIRFMVQLIDLDLPQGIQHAMMSSAKVDEGRFWRIFRCGLFLQTIVGIVGALLLGFGWKLLHFETTKEFVHLMPIMFGIAAVQMLSDCVGSTFLMPFYAREDYKQFALTNSIVPAFALLVNVGLVVWLRSPVAMMWTMLFESSFNFGLKLFYFRKQFGLEHVLPKFERTAAREILSVGIKSYPGNLSSRIAGVADKVILGVVSGMDIVLVYNIATKIPQSLLAIVGSATSLAVPEMIHVAQNEPDKFRDILRRNVSFLSVLYSCAIIIPSGFAVVILKAWMRFDAPGFAEVSILMSIYYALEMNFSTITTAFFAYKKAQFLFPFALWNSLVTVFATGVMSRRYGLAGLGWMNALIDLVQLYPLHWLLRRLVVPDDSEWWYIGRLGGAVAVTAGIAVTISWLLKGVPIGREAYWYVLLMPITSMGCFIAAARMGLVQLPNSLQAMLRKRQLLAKVFGSAILER